MRLDFRRANIEDIPIAIKLQNEAFYQDFLRYGSCPSYNRPESDMRDIITNHHDFLILADDIPVGNMIIKLREGNECHLNSLSILPEYQGKGIGKAAMAFIETAFPDSVLFTLDTPADKQSNVAFYVSCGYSIVGHVEFDEMKLVLLERRRIG